MQENPRPQEALSSLLRSALETEDGGAVSVGEITDRVAERGFGLLLILFCLPMLVPMPPGTSGPVGLLIALLGLQILSGRARPWLPERVRRFRLSPKVIQMLQTRGVGFMERLERLSRPRWHFTENLLVLRTTAVLLVLMGIVMFLPVPFMNIPPALAALIAGVGYMNRDGMFLLLGLLLKVGILVFLAFNTHMLVEILKHVLARFS